SALDSILWCFFFFQAEDGIRDRNVTGVQTCALPIYERRGGRLVGRARLRPGRKGGLGGGLARRRGAQPGQRLIQGGDVGAALLRSEERRVGKECRSRGAPGDQRKDATQRKRSDLCGT